MERIYPAYGAKIRTNSDLVKDNPDNFAETLDKEYTKARASKAKAFKRLDKLPVRIYGSGDYIKEHLPVFQKVNFKFFIISKTLTELDFAEELEKLLQIPNLTSIVLSFDRHNIANYDNVKHLFGSPKIKFAYTGDCDSFLIERDLNSQKFNIFFNTGNTKAAKESSKAIKQRCPADSGEMKLKEACTWCHKCWK